MIGTLKALYDNFKISHRDIKPENLLITGEDDNIDLILLDFGLAKKPKSTSVGITGGKVGTEDYMAPEVVSKTEGVRITEKVDIWSAGCVLYFLCTGKKAFKV